jgi:serine/threonine protein kinase
MYKMLTGRHPFYREGDNEKTYIKKITSPELFDSVDMPFSMEAKSLFLKLCSRNLSDRYSAN